MTSEVLPGGAARGAAAAGAGQGESTSGWRTSDHIPDLGAQPGMHGGCVKRSIAEKNVRNWLQTECSLRPSAMKNEVRLRQTLKSDCS